jgi:hypothetical protein
LRDDSLIPELAFSAADDCGLMLAWSLVHPYFPSATNDIHVSAGGQKLKSDDQYHNLACKIKIITMNRQRIFNLFFYS